MPHADFGSFGNRRARHHLAIVVEDDQVDRGRGPDLADDGREVTLCGFDVNDPADGGDLDLGGFPAVPGSTFPGSWVSTPMDFLLSGIGVSENVVLWCLAFVDASPAQ